MFGVSFLSTKIKITDNVMIGGMMNKDEKEYKMFENLSRNVINNLLWALTWFLGCTTIFTFIAAIGIKSVWCAFLGVILIAVTMFVGMQANDY